MRLHRHAAWDVRRALIGIVAAAVLVMLAAPALAGGFAVVRLDETPGEIAVNTPWRFGFMVRQHDVTPTSDVTPVVRAVHKETGDEVTATGQQEGPVGHFTAELTFPRAGEWKWAIHPEPFAETSFETITVIERLGGLTYQAGIVAGSCADWGDVVYRLGDVEPQTMTGKSARLPVAVGASTIAAPLPELLDAGHAIGISAGDADAAPVACGDLLAETATSERPSELVLGLQGSASPQNVGLAILRDEGERTAVTLYLLNAGAEPAPAISAETATVEIVGEMNDAWAFAPASLTVPTGATITWVNESDAAHTITGDDRAFDDSGLVEPGQSFRQTFAAPGSYHYRCASHPWMEGVIVVE